MCIRDSEYAGQDEVKYIEHGAAPRTTINSTIDHRSQNVYTVVLTYAVDEYAGQDEVKYIEHGTAPQPDHVRDVGIRFRTARVELHVLFRHEADQVELAVGLVVAHVPLLRLLHQI